MKNRFFDIAELSQKVEKKSPSTLLQSKYLLAHYQKLDNIEKELQRLPEREEFFFLQTQKQFNAFTFIPFVLRWYRIKHLYAATYSISRRVIDALIELHDTGKIEQITLNISDSMIVRNPVTIDLLTAMVKTRGNMRVIFTWNHSKISLMETDTGHYVMEGSGNWSENARYEQYMLGNSKGLFEFRKELFEHVEIKHIADHQGLRAL